MNLPRLLIATAAAGCAAVTAAAPASAARSVTGYRSAQFDVTIIGTQTTEWEHHHIKEGRCDASVDAQGKETWRFRSSRPLRVRALSALGTTTLIGPKLGAVELPVTGTVNRQSTRVIGPSEVCSSGDGTATPVTPPPPDCGTKRMAPARLEIGYRTTPKDFLETADEFSNTVRDPFRNCPGGPGFPSVLAYDDHNRRIGRVLPSRDLFRYGKSIVVARGHEMRRYPEGWHYTEITWSLSFKKVVPKPPRRHR